MQKKFYVLKFSADKRWILDRAYTDHLSSAKCIQTKLFNKGKKGESVALHEMNELGFYVLKDMKRIS